ncbi:bacteriohemerythrin [Janthinobacterium fluminis]|uniref:Hemerythrin family protein n=1 Tax=Janthinobacterium fluminis TaxID=2987524 RepID=A0ABT5JXV8_9BURK|nr:hemerythrin family protein [Janthinobacterium fluminis]MDC8756988.1 hemerythrin family protein [Janthinobacterium fluminis]
MQKIKWSSEMELGILGMDESHKALFDALAMLADTPDAQFGEAFTRATSAIERDFADEEEVMERIGFPGLRAHREQHTRVLSGLHHADPYVRQGDVALGRKAMALLPQWFLIHQATMDLALAAALEAAGQPVPAIS